MHMRRCWCWIICLSWNHSTWWRCCRNHWRSCLLLHCRINSLLLIVRIWIRRTMITLWWSFKMKTKKKSSISLCQFRRIVLKRFINQKKKITYQLQVTLILNQNFQLEMVLVALPLNLVYLVLFQQLRLSYHYCFDQLNPKNKKKSN